MTRDEAVAAFKAGIAGLQPAVVEDAQWPSLRVRIRTFIGSADIPDVLITSVRSVVRRRGQVVVVREKSGEHHVTPGGTREAGESLEETLRRELLEESGWHVGAFTPIGFLHISPLDAAPPPGFRFAFGDTVNLVHVTDGMRYQRDAMDRTQIEAGASLASFSRAFSLVRSPGQRAILEAARAARRR